MSFDFSFFPDDLVRSLSPSRRRMLQTMMAFCTDCKVICLEQPHVGLTTSDQESLISNLEYLAKGRTILISMEPNSIIEEIAHKVLLLYRGKVLFYNSVKNLKLMLAKYLCVYVHKEGKGLVTEAPLEDIIEVNKKFHKIQFEKANYHDLQSTQTDSRSDYNTKSNDDKPLIANLTKIHDDMDVIGYSLMFSEGKNNNINKYLKKLLLTDYGSIP